MTNKLSLLLELEYNDYQVVIEELNEIKKGTSYHYVIDTFDLRDYCYPFGLKEDEDSPAYLNKGIEYVADEQYALYQLFNSVHEKVILLDEYIPELYSFKRSIDFAFEQRIKIVDTLKRYQDEYFNRGAMTDRSLDNLEGMLETKLSLVLSISVDFLHRGIDKLSQIFRDRQILISTEEYITLGYEGILGKAFDIHRGTFLCGEIIREIESSHPIRDKNPEREISRKNARDRDAKVVDRIFSINNYLERIYLKETQLKNRVILLYLSSAQNSRVIFNSQAVRNHLPIIEGKRLNPHRNRAQLFLKTLCMTSNDLDEAKENVVYLRSRVLEIKRYQDEIHVEGLSQYISDILQKKFKYYREDFENFAILNQYDNIRELVEATLVKLKSQKKLDQLGTKLIKVLQKVVEMGEQQKELSPIYHLKLDNWENQIKFALYVQEVLNTFKSGDVNLRFLMGKDHIMGSTHHLPMTFFSTDVKFKQVVDEIGKIIIDPSLQDSTDEMIPIIEEAYQQAIEMSPSLEERLIKAFFLLIVPNTENIEDTNKLARDWIKDILKTEIQGYSNRKDLDLIERDYRYFVAWAERRCGNYEESIKILTKAQNEFPDDPRYVHGLCLSQYCEYEDKPNLEVQKKIRILEQSLFNGNQAHSLYQTIKQTPIIVKTKYAILNTIAYVYTELYALDLAIDNKIYLEQARATLVQLKSQEADYKKYPEYLHTEAYIELYEFRRIEAALREDKENKSLFELALLKIGFALRTINDSIEGIEKKKLKRSLDKFSALRDEIVQEQQIFLNAYGSPMAGA